MVIVLWQNRVLTVFQLLSPLIILGIFIILIGTETLRFVIAMISLTIIFADRGNSEKKLRFFSPRSFA